MAMRSGRFRVSLSSTGQTGRTGRGVFRPVPGTTSVMSAAMKPAACPVLRVVTGTFPDSLPGRPGTVLPLGAGRRSGRRAPIWRSCLPVSPARTSRASHAGPTSRPLIPCRKAAARYCRAGGHASGWPDAATACLGHDPAPLSGQPGRPQWEKRLCPAQSCCGRA